MVEVRVCIGTSCHLNGSYNVVQGIQQLVEEHALHDNIDLEAYFCMKQCECKGVSISVDGENFRIEPEKLNEFFEGKIMSKL
ncbi:MAG TPA: (2Fe-2S) ferredoxin domain-containing protein [Clostridiales bacterium]|nr:(2Fe-2S) ferredoxin domain-containing protein [Clostridiales bacterium]